jgi:putative ABC transport system permease protein
MVTMLQKKIFRDIGENRWWFLTIVGICTLGIALLSGVNLYTSTVENDLADYYMRANLADFWIYKADVSESDLGRIQTLPDVEMAQRRKMLEVGLGGEIKATLRLHATEEQARINIPELLDGSLLDGTETDALLLDSRFAEANGLVPGDSLRFEAGGQQKEWLIKGIIRDVEYIYYAPEGLTIPDYHKYGFAYTNASALPQVPYNEMVISMNEDAKRSQEEITAEIRETLPGANILSRLHQLSTSNIENDLEGIKEIGMLFPMAFFLTAALVTWITVGRMMENQRQHLGTLRSLGYSKAEIMGRYGLYGILITIPSTILGWLISRHLIAESLYRMGIAYYTIEENGVDVFSPHFFWAALCVALVTGGAAFLSCQRSLKTMPAALMRPTPPAQGHRILLEKISPFWRGLSFSGKIVTRNLFRNKARMLMGLVGIIGSTALILCSLGLTNSMDAMLDKAFDETMRYDVEIKLKTPVPLDSVVDIYEILRDAQSIDATMAFSVYLYGSNGSVQNPYLVVMDDQQSSLRFIGSDGGEVSLPDNGAFITPRMAKALHAEVGDVITAERLDGTVLQLNVANIVDFPVGNEIYISRTTFSKISSLPFRVRTLLVRGHNLDLSALKDDSRISLVETKAEMETNELILMGLLRSLQMIMISFAGLLAIAVMMVLGQMNYHERIRELATLKVLGFHQKEMERLVLHENFWITILGLPFGVLAGFGLLGVILEEATTADMEIGLFISPASVAVGCALVLVCTILVGYMIGRKFKSINMVASLKSVE